MKFSRFLFLPFVLFSLFIFLGCPPTEPEEDENAENGSDNEKASITGKVFSKESQKAIYKAEVTTEPATESVKTDSVGLFNITENVIAGTTYKILAKSTGFKDFELTKNCAKLSFEDSGYYREYMFSQELGYAPISYVKRDPKGRIEIQKYMSRFINVDGLMLPHKIETKEYAYNNVGEQKQTLSANIIVKS